MFPVSPEEVVVRVIVPKPTYALATALVVWRSLNVDVHHPVFFIVTVSKYIGTSNNTCARRKVNLNKD